MDASHFDSFVDALIDDLTPSRPPDGQGDRTLFHLLERPRPVVDDAALLSVLAAR